MSEKREKLKELCDLFQANIKEYKSGKYDEANTRTDFIDKFFELLDWDVRNNQGYAESYREVVREDKVIIEGKPKAPDYSFRIGGIRKFFLEAKKPSVNIKEDTEPAFQIRRYGYTAKLPLSILTDFEEFAIYDTRIKPEKTDKASVARVFYCTYEEYEKHFEFIYNTFSKDAINKGSFDKYVVENKNKKGSSEVDKEFLSLIEDWRESLAKNIAIRNKDLDIYYLNNSVQVIIDRIIFLRIAEDRNMEKYGLLAEVIKKEEIYKNLNKIFLKANDKYNSGLFKPEKWISELDIDDKIFQNIIKYLYYPDCPYELSVLPIEILGNIYEQFLGKTIRLTSSHQAKVEEKEEVRKAGGVYYTPQYIVNYIVQNTVGEKIKGVDLYNHPRLTILDPACGSGSFLVGTYSFLLDKYLESYTDKKRLEKSLKNGFIYQVSGNTYRLSITVKQSILLNHIFGVDIDNQAVEVTKLSLLLKLMEDENTESADRLFKHSDVKLLPDLQNNIKCGNSLIGSDFYSDKNLSLFGKEEMRKVNTFDWEKEFVNVFKDGGFDCVIGNPPYVFGGNYGIEEFEKIYFKNKYIAGAGKINLFTLFIEKVLFLLKEKGAFSYIIPNTFLRVTSYSKSREFALKNYAIRQIVDLGGGVFEGATTSSIIFVFEKNKNVKNNQITIYNGIKSTATTISQNNLLKDDFIISTITSKDTQNIIDKITSDKELLGNLCKELIFGVVITKNIDEVVSHKKIQGYKKFLEGKDISRYCIKPVSKFLLYKKELLHRARTPEIFEAKEKLLIQRITGGTRPLHVAYDSEQYYNKESINNIILKDDTAYSYKFILGILNSTLISWFYCNQFTNNSTLTVNLSKQYLSLIPIPKSNNKAYLLTSVKVVSMVEQMLSAQKELQSATNDSDRKILQQKCDILDKQIDKLVYELYGLTEDEIKIVEGVGK